MAKRFTDTDLFKKRFLRSLPSKYKLLWIYLYHDCNHAGIWEVDFEVANIYIGEPIVEEKAIEMFKGKIQVIDNGAKWFIPSFIEFQYGVLNPENRAHLSVINILNKQGVCKGLVRGLQGRKDMDMDMDMDKEMDKDRVETQFEEWWKLYSKPEGKKKSLVKWLKLKQPDRGKCLEVVGDYVISKPDKQYRLNPLTYLNGDHWDDEIILPDELKPKKHPYATCKCGFDYKLRPNEIEAAKKKPCPECGGKVEIIYA